MNPNLDSPTWCSRHQREKTGYTTLFCPTCDSEPVPTTFQDRVAVIAANWYNRYLGDALYPVNFMLVPFTILPDGCLEVRLLRTDGMAAWVTADETMDGRWLEANLTCSLEALAAHLSFAPLSTAP